MVIAQNINNNQLTAQILNELAQIFISQYIYHNRSNVAPNMPQTPTKERTPSDYLNMARDSAHSALVLAHNIGDIGAQLISYQALKGSHI